MGEGCPYKSPTDMGVNRIAGGIVNDTIVRAASREECVRRYERVKGDFDEGKANMDMLARAFGNGQGRSTESCATAFSRPGN